MVFSRNQTNLQGGFQKVITSRRSILSSANFGDLPSLRYGSIGAKSLLSGPLRVVSHRHFDCTSPRRAPTRSIQRSYSSSDVKNAPVRPPRRVRFTLPSVDDDKIPSGGGGVAKPAAGDARTRAPASQHADVRARHILANQQVPVNGIDAGDLLSGEAVLVTSSPGVRIRVHPTGRYIKGTLSPTSNASPHAGANLGGQELLRAARDGDERELRDLLRRVAMVGISEGDLNAVDCSGRTLFSYVASNGPVDILEKILLMPGLDSNRSDNEGNTPLHFAAQAGQVECLNCILSKCAGIQIDARNNLGFTPLMKAALQGRNKCAKLLLFAGANPTLRDNGRGFRADQWARFCGRYVCADVIEKHARQRLLERSTSYGNWGAENELGARVLLGKVVPVPQIQTHSDRGIKSKLRKVFRTSSGPNHNTEHSSARLVTQLTSAALCASTPVLPTASNVPPVVKSLIRPLTVPRLQVTLVNNGNIITDSAHTNFSNDVCKEKIPTAIVAEGANEPIVKPGKKKK